MTAPVYESAASASGSSGSITINKPTGTAEGDLLVAFFRCIADQTVTDPGDWTTLDDDANSGTSNYEVTHAAFWKVAGASEGSDYTFTHTSSGSEGCILRISGADTTTPAAAFPTFAEGYNSAADPPASGTVDSDDYLAIASAAAAAATIDTAPTNYTLRVDATGLDVATRSLTSATSEDPGTFSPNPVYGWVAFTLLIAPGVAVTYHDIAPTDDVTTTGWTSTPLYSRIDDDPDSPDGTVITATAS